MTTIHVKGIQIFIDRDKEGFVSLSTDGHLGSRMDPIIAAIRSLQDDDDREMDEMKAQHDAWVRSGPRGGR